jgi:hypothetical protein
MNTMSTIEIPEAKAAEIRAALRSAKQLRQPWDCGFVGHMTGNPETP